MAISDDQAIRNLLYRYAEAIDAADFDAVAELFANATLTAEGVPDMANHGYEAVLDQYRTTTRIHADGTPRTAHVMTNAIIEIDGDRATARSRYTVSQQTDTLPLQPIIVGRYHDTFERADGQWRFATRHFFMDLMGDLAHHLLIDLDEELD